MIDVKAEFDFKIVYNVRILDKFRGLPSDLTETTLEVPKSNKKHKIQPKQKFVFMTSAHFEGKFVLNSSAFNKHLPLLSLVEQAFLNNQPNEYCEKVKEKEKCRIKKCVKRCSKLCQNCDDEETCQEDCKTRCEQVVRRNLYKRSPRKPRRVLFARTNE